MSVQENKTLAISFFEASFSGDFDRWRSLMTDDFRYWNGGKWKDREGYLAVAERLSQDLIEGEYTMEIGSVTAEDDRVVIEAETNYDVPGGHHYQNFYAWILQIRDGKILSLKGHADTLHASRIFGNPDVSAEGDERESPVEEVIQTLTGTTPQPTPTD